MSVEITRVWECFSCGAHFSTAADAQAHHGHGHTVAYCACDRWQVAS